MRKKTGDMNEAPKELTVAEARYLLVRLYRPHLQTGTVMDDQTQQHYQAVLAYITYKTTVAQWEEVCRRANLTNPAGEYIYAPPGHEWISRMERANNMWGRYRDKYNQFLEQTGHEWLAQARAAGARII